MRLMGLLPACLPARLPLATCLPGVIKNFTETINTVSHLARGWESFGLGWA